MVQPRSFGEMQFALSERRYVARALMIIADRPVGISWTRSTGGNRSNASPSHDAISSTGYRLFSRNRTCGEEQAIWLNTATSRTNRSRDFLKPSDSMYSRSNTANEYFGPKIMVSQ